MVSLPKKRIETLVGRWKGAAAAEEEEEEKKDSLVVIPSFTKRCRRGLNQF